MLSVLLAEHPHAVESIVGFYRPPESRAGAGAGAGAGPIRVLDPTCGTGSLTSRLSGVTRTDIAPRCAGAVAANIGVLPFAAGAFEIAVFDPPYLYGRSSAKLHDRPHGDWESLHTRMELPDQFAHLCRMASRELARVLVPTGLLVAKVADSRYKGRLILNHVRLIEAFESRFALRDLLIYVRLATGMFVNTKSAQNTHGYYVIMERR